MKIERLATADDFSPVTVPAREDARGQLFIAELPLIVPFAITRMFWVTGVPKNARRGGHAHRRCHQFLICASGAVEVKVFDGAAKRQFDLTPGMGLHVPPGIWAEQSYGTPETVVIVLCDRPYEEEDYIWDLVSFTAFRDNAPGRAQ